MTDKTIWHPAEERPSKSCPILIHQDDCDEYRVANYCKEHDLVITDEAPDGDRGNGEMFSTLLQGGATLKIWKNYKE